GYPVFGLGFEPHLQAVQDFVASLENVRSVGRQGGFCYPNMHSAMRMGADAADEILKQETGSST
ncbi:MAG: amine oxidase, partial [Verrucomicrobia bacterium]|nr:amine oxidase [Verrucomicrobiota bacterium]